MTKKNTYNTKSREELVLELAKLKSTIGNLRIEKSKTGKAKDYRSARKNVARVMTALHSAK